MAINPALLIAAPILQDTFVDNATDVAMSAGIVTCFRDNARTTLKNWYYQSGTPGNYTYVPLANPLTLSAAGTITDPNGNDTIPFFYPYSEDDNESLQPYYITVVNSNLQLQFTRQNFPFIGQAQSTTTNPTLDNILTNNVFYHNIGSLNATNVTNATLAPGAHDGFNTPDIIFSKSTTGATDTITFTKFGLGVDPLLNDVTPEYYLNFDCSAPQAGETFKYIQFPINLHIKTLENQPATLTIQTQNVGGNVNNTLTLSIVQFFGTGASPASNTVQIGTAVTSNSWNKFIFNFVFPDASTAVLGGGGDDALYLQIGYPLSMTCNINFTLPSIYLGNKVPSNSFFTYDQIDTVINSPRTGDIRTSLNTFYPFGWVPLNNGTIGNASSHGNSRANIDTWPLFNLIWTAFNAYTVSTTNSLAQMVNSSGSNVAYGSSAIADFNANNAIALTQTMGKVILGTAPIAALTNAFATTFTASSSSGLLITTSNNVLGYFNGMPVYVSNSGGALPGNLSANTIYYVSGISGPNRFYLSTTFANAIAGTVIAFSSSGSGTQTVTAMLAGTFEGEYAHTLLATQLPSSFTPNLASTTLTNLPSTGAQTLIGITGSGSTAVAMTNNAWGNPFNVTQPGNFLNMYMKL